MTHLTEEQLIDLYYDQVQDPWSGHPHLKECQTCRQSFQELALTLEAFDHLPVPEPPPFTWREPWTHRLARYFGIYRTGRYRTWILAPALAAALFAAFFMGRVTQQPIVIAKPATQLADSGRQRILLVALNDHLQRSQMVLLELANGDRLNFPAAQERARNLIGENRLYRQTVLYSGDSNYSALLDDLDRVLTATANAQSKSSTNDRERIEQLLFKIRVTDSNLERGPEKL